MAEQYLIHAREAERLAREAASEQERRVHLDVAALWLELARRKAERVGAAQQSEMDVSGSAEGSRGTAPEISIYLDETLQRLLISVKGDIDGQIVADRVTATFLEQPRVTYMDMVYDLTKLTSGVGPAQMDAIAAAYLASNKDPRVPCRTAIVSPDPFYKRWDEALSRQFNREHRSFANFEEAESFLSEPMASRRPFDPRAFEPGR